MKKLNDNQIVFLLENFFRNDKYPGWRNIGVKLLETGECIVPGDKCIWQGGIGNFIGTEPAEGTVGCLLYDFDLEFFLTSKWYAEIAKRQMEIMEDEQSEALNKYQNMVRNLNDINEIYDVSNG